MNSSTPSFEPTGGSDEASTGDRETVMELAGDEARQVLDSIAAGVVIVSKEGRITYINGQGRRLLTATSLDPMGRSLREFEPYTVWPNGSRCTYDDYPPIRCLRTGQMQSGDVVGVRLPGDRLLWFSVTAEPLFEPQTGEVEAAVVTVILSQDPQHYEAVLRHTQERYRRLVENAPDAIVVHRQGSIVFVNEAGVKLWGGRSREDFIGRDILDFIDPADRETASRRIEMAMAGGTTPLKEQRHVRLDGRQVIVEVTGNSCIYDNQPSVQVIFRDVTRRRRIYQVMRRQREILRIFFKRIPVLVGIFDADGRVKAVNEEWKRVMGWGRELDMHGYFEKLYPDPQARRQAQEHTALAGPGWAVFRCRVRDGSDRDLSFANMVLNSGDRIAMALDVTEARAAEQALKKAKDELERRVAERTEELTRKNKELKQRQRFLESTLAAQEHDRKLVAYEIHDTILQEVIGALMHVDTSYDVEPGSPAQRRSLVQAQQLLRKCIDGARQMISGLRPPIIDEQGVAGAIDFLVSEFNRQEMNIRFSHEMKSDRLPKDLETTVYRIVQEALTNVQRHSQTDSAWVDIREADASVHLTVQDNGVGFDPEVQCEGHFGLEGLRQRAQLAGGRASVESRAGEGTKITVEIPIPPDRAEGNPENDS